MVWTSVAPLGGATGADEGADEAAAVAVAAFAPFAAFGVASDVTALILAGAAQPQLSMASASEPGMACFQFVSSFNAVNDGPFSCRLLRM